MSALAPCRWIEACINEDIGSITTLEENLRNGVVLAKLARFFDPSTVKRIFEVCTIRIHMMAITQCGLMTREFLTYSIVRQ